MMEQYTLFNPRCVSALTAKPKPQLQSHPNPTLTSPPQTTLLFPEYFCSSQSHLDSYIFPKNNAARLSQGLLKRTEDDTCYDIKVNTPRRMTAKSRESCRKLHTAPFQTRTQSKSKVKTQHYSEILGHPAKPSLYRTLEPREQPRYLIKKSNKWRVNQIFANRLRPQSECHNVRRGEGETEGKDFLFAVAVSFGVRFENICDIKIVTIGGDHELLECIKRRNWWSIMETGGSLVWSNKASMVESKRYHSRPLMNEQCLSYLGREYSIAKILWPNSKPRAKIPSVKLEPPYLQDFRQLLTSKLTVISPNEVKVYSYLPYQKYLKTKSLLKTLDNQNIFHKTYWEKQEALPEGKWILKTQSQVRLIPSTQQLLPLLNQPFLYYQEHCESKIKEERESRIKGVFLVVIINGHLKVYLHEDIHTFTLNPSHSNLSFLPPDDPLQQAIRNILAKIFQSVYKKLLTKVYCFQLFEVQMMPSETLVVSSVQPLKSVEGDALSSLYQNVFLLVLDPVFHPSSYQYPHPYSQNKLALVFDSFMYRCEKQG